MITVEIDDKQIMSFIRKSPARAKWASSEALKMTGGHFRKKMAAYIQKGGPGTWPELSGLTKKIKSITGKDILPPIQRLSKMVAFKYGKYKGRQRVRIGFLAKTPAMFARRLQYGYRWRIKRKELALLHRVGLHVKKKFVEVPARPIIEPFYRKYKKDMPLYFEKKFFNKFFSKEKPRLKV